MKWRVRRCHRTCPKIFCSSLMGQYDYYKYIFLFKLRWHQESTCQVWHSFGQPLPFRPHSWWPELTYIAKRRLFGPVQTWPPECRKVPMGSQSWISIIQTCAWLPERGGERNSCRSACNEVRQRRCPLRGRLHGCKRRGDMQCQMKVSNKAPHVSGQRQRRVAAENKTPLVNTRTIWDELGGRDPVSFETRVGG